jgi:hypothetical protein
MKLNILYVLEEVLDELPVWQMKLMLYCLIRSPCFDFIWGGILLISEDESLFVKFACWLAEEH